MAHWGSTCKDLGLGLQDRTHRDQPDLPGLLGNQTQPLTQDTTNPGGREAERYTKGFRGFGYQVAPAISWNPVRVSSENLRGWGNMAGGQSQADCRKEMSLTFLSRRASRLGF